MLAQTVPLPISEQQLLEKGMHLYDNKQYKEANLLFDELLTVAKASNNPQLLGQVYFNLGTFYQERNAPNKSLDLFLHSLELLDSKVDAERANIIVPAMEESPSTYLLEMPEDASLICNIYNKIGGVYFNQENYEKAEKYWKKSFNVAQEYKSAKELANASNNLGELKRLNNQPKKALQFYQYALNIQQAIQDSTGLLVSWGNIGTAYLKKGQPDSAKYYYDTAYQWAQVLEDSVRLLHTSRDYGAYHQLTNNVQQALDWNKKTLELAQAQKDTSILIEVHKKFVQLYEKQKNWDALLVHQKQWTALQQAQILKKSKKMAMQIEAEYVVNQHEKEVLKLRQEAALQQEKNRQQSIIQWSISLVLLLLLLAALWTLHLIRKHNKEVNHHLQKIKQQNKEKETLLQEIHHRVKNNLQVVTSLLNLQSHDIEDVAIKDLFAQSQYRINSMAIVHEMLYQSSNLSAINYQEYLEQLIQRLIRSMKGKGQEIQLEMDIAPISLNVDTAVPLGLLITELITNSLKYGLEKGKVGVLTVHLKPYEEESYLLEIGDNGKGIGKDWTQASKPKSLGLRLVRQLVLQLEGELTLNTEKQGTHYQLYFQEIKMPT